MATISHSSLAFTGASASDLFRSSKSDVNGMPLKALGRARFGSKSRGFAVSAKLRKVKKHDYPWPKDPKDVDPNVKGGVLTHLSHFKPLKEKPKPVTLDFEKPLVGLSKKIMDVIAFLVLVLMLIVGFTEIVWFDFIILLSAGAEDGK